MRRIRRHLTFANVASALALFIAISGGTAGALNGRTHSATASPSACDCRASARRPGGVPVRHSERHYRAVLDV
jgi:hypothetical protein